MFEKEAEEHGFGKGCTVNPTVAWTKGAEFGFNNANEWHYVKDGDLPKENQEVLVFFTLPDKSKNSVAIVCFKNNDFDIVDLQDVICWKEIILPKGFEK